MIGDFLADIPVALAAAITEAVTATGAIIVALLTTRAQRRQRAVDSSDERWAKEHEFLDGKTRDLMTWLDGQLTTMRGEAEKAQEEADKERQRRIEVEDRAEKQRAEVLARLAALEKEHDDLQEAHRVCSRRISQLEDQIRAAGGTVV